MKRIAKDSPKTGLPFPKEEQFTHFSRQQLPYLNSMAGYFNDWARHGVSLHFDRTIKVIGKNAHFEAFSSPAFPALPSVVFCSSNSSLKQKPAGFCPALICCWSTELCG